MVRDLLQLWLSPVAAILQVGRRPCLIFDFTWSSLNKATAQEAPEEIMRFGVTLRRIIRRILQADPQLGPFYLGKVDLVDSYMRIWVRLEDTLFVAFLVPRNKSTDKQLVSFHMSLPMGYVDTAPFFYISTKTIADMSNNTMVDRHHTPPHYLETLLATLAPYERAPKTSDN